MPLQQLFTSRKPYDAETFVGQEGKLFYNESNGVLRLGDGSTPGGLPIPITLATSSFAGSVKPGLGLQVSVDGTISIDATSSFAFVGNKLTILAATSSTFGGVKLGPGVTTNGQGQIIIDSTGLDFSFGDFSATTENVAPFGASLSSINPNQDINIVSNGTGTVNVIGAFNVYKPDGDVAGALAIPPIFTVKSDGQVQMLVPSADSTEGAVSIIGGLDGVFQPPINTGVMLHVTGIAGSPGVPSRIYNDAQNAFAAFVARRYNGTAAAPTAVLANEEIMRLSGTAHNGTTIPGSANQRIVFTALGNQTLTNQGGAIEFWTTPLNTTTLAKVATINNVDGITSTKFTGPLVGTATTATYAVTAGTAGTVTTAAQPAITSVGTLTSLSVNSGGITTTGTVSGTTGTFNRVNALVIRGVRDAGTIAAAGTLTIDFSTDSIVHCVWSDGMTINYQNYTAGAVVRVIARKATGSGVDTISLDGITAANVSSGSTTSGNYSADTTAFIEFTCVGTTIGTVYAKL